MRTHYGRRPWLGLYDDRLPPDIEPEYANALDWTAVHIFFGDERTVAPDHEESNYRMAREALLDRVAVRRVPRSRCEPPP